MSDPVVLDLREHPRPLPDLEARSRILADLETNLLVEAGAGSGKTTALVGRMVELLRTGAARAPEVAAVTFTRKAAAELRERFQNGLEKAARVETNPEAKERILDGLHQIDRAFIGTIHAFCARLLRERPIEAGLDPGFEEMLEAENARLMKRYWTTFLERLASDEDPALEEIAGLGLSVHQLEWAYRDVSENLDVDFPADAVPAPEPSQIDPVRKRFDLLLDQASHLLPSREPTKGWDPVQIRMRRLLFVRGDAGWSDAPSLIGALQELCTKSTYRVTQNRWDPGGGRSPAAKALGDDLTDFVAPGGPARRLLGLWHAHRYPPVVRLIQRAATGFAQYRRSSGRLSFQDLLVQTVELLRRSPRARRDLGQRYRRVLVDEFQDTDPIQAEVVFLLASDPEADTDAKGWWNLDPRPGALFVVGDPKQSIYRFRRADISIYNQVKARFKTFGDVLSLTANFRSRHDIGRLVNDVFGTGALFPPEEEVHQAPFAPLLPQRNDVPAHEGVFTYRVSASKSFELAGKDADLLAEWIARRIEAGERTPGDFMILTRTKPRLDLYARALEDRGLPVDVAGAGVGYQEVIRELISVLGALLDPDNDLLVVHSLMGLFFGLDPDTLIRHRLGGGRWSFVHRPSTGDTKVDRALARLHDWWMESRILPADIFVTRVVAELGLFPFAASSDLGSQRTGALVYALDAVRAQAVAGDTSLLGAVEALEGAIDWEDAEAPLEPGRSDAVRVMNLHKAKGLEATVVILAYPTGKPTVGRSKLKVTRPNGRQPEGWVTIEEVIRSRHGTRSITLAAPEQWDQMRADEIAYEEAEEDRLLYVAATRACDELVVAQREGGSKSSKSPWEKLEPWLSTHAQELDLAPGSSRTRDRLERTAADILVDVEAVDAARMARGEPTYRFNSVTTVAKDFEEPEGTEPTPVTRATAPAPARPETPRGYEWGSAVHAALAAAARGIEGGALREVCRVFLVEQERPVGSDGAPTELAALMKLVSHVRASALWLRATAAETRYSEIHFVAPRPGPTRRVPEMIEGVIDLVFKETGGWVIADYKTDVGDDPDFPRRSEAYRRQVDLYADCWEELTGEPVVERVLLYTAQGREERW